MKSFLFRVTVVLFLVLAISGISAAEGGKKAKAAKKGKLHHVVSFKFKKEATPQQIQKVVDDFRGLKKSMNNWRTPAFRSGVPLAPF